jgi:hypothetical protein
MIASPLLVFELFFRSKKEANSLHSGQSRTGMRAVKGGEVIRSLGEVKTLDGPSAGPGAASCGEGNVEKN